MQAARREVRVRLHESDVQWEISDNEGLRWGDARRARQGPANKMREGDETTTRGGEQKKSEEYQSPTIESLPGRSGYGKLRFCLPNMNTS